MEEMCTLHTAYSSNQEIGIFDVFPHSLGSSSFKEKRKNKKIVMTFTF